MEIPHLEIDGSYGEGGGQVLRTSLTLSVLTGRAIRIRKIRANRRKPGLAPQHLSNVLALGRICSAKMEGAKLASTHLNFEPGGAPRPGEYLFDVTDAAKGGSAGSVTLILQTLLLPLAFAGSTSRLTLRGGTHVAWSPPYEYVAEIFLPALAGMGLGAGCIMRIPGFYPVGGGEVEVEITGIRGALQPLTLTQRGEFRRVHGSATACNLPSHIPQRMASRAVNFLRDAGFRAQITPRREMCAGAGAGIYLTAEYDHASAGFSALGERGKPSERVAEEACDLLLEFHRSGAAVDRYLADQLLLPLALAEGRSSFTTERITGHLITNAHIIKEFIDAKISIDGEEGSPGAVEVTGIGHRNANFV